MSNARKGSIEYTQGYLKSVAWFRRRDEWFAKEIEERGGIYCAACTRELSRRKCELHHMSYDGVVKTRTGWSANEAHEDLIAMHVRCHEWLHQLLDRDPAFRYAKSRAVATRLVLARLKAKLLNTIRELQASAVETEGGKDVRQ